MSTKQQEMLSSLAEIVERVAGVPAEAVLPEKSFTDDLALDSLAVVEIAFSMQEHVGVEIPEEDLARIRTVQDFLDFVELSEGRN
ncbi:acyl carrier protein [Streptosporangium sp. NPDC002721]|uniref:acyl carrier protein n=1 Tax=Streptosporangium sp. NPDC002721 TaxID=3366188 RepID=UPI0036BEF2BA